jgi:hypothetical protein
MGTCLLAVIDQQARTVLAQADVDGNRTRPIVASPGGRNRPASGSNRTPGYHGISMEVRMTDMLIRDVPDEVVAAVDAHAGRLGLSRSEYVRRRLAQDAAVPGSAVTVQDLARFAEVFGDLDDPGVMSGAWE